MRSVVGAWDPEVIDRAVPLLPEASRSEHIAAGEPPVRLNERQMRVWEGHDPKTRDGGLDRSGSLVKIGRVLYDAGAARPVIVSALEERDVALGYRKYAGRRDAGERYHEIVDELERSGRSASITFKNSGTRTNQHNRAEQTAQNAPSANGESPNGNVARGQGQPTHDELRNRYTTANDDYSYGLGEWRRYENGVWPTVPELTVKRGICEVIEAAKPEGIKPTNSLLTSVTELTRVKVAVADEQWDADPDILVCENGALRISTRELGPHRRESYATSAVPYDYDPGAVPVFWNYFLGETVGAARTFLQEFAGYALTTEMSHELALWLFGPPGSGKSTFLAGLQAMLGHRAGLLGLAEIERNRFALAGLPGKTLVAASEQPSSYLASTNVLNAIISGEPLQVERKYRDPVTVLPRCKIAWAMNELPRVADANSGLFRRVKVVKFPQLPADRRDPDIKSAIEGEGAGILNWALEGLERLQRRGAFDVPEGVEEATAQFRENNDVPALFVADRCVRDADASEQASSLYGEYRDWCEANGHRPQSSTRVADDWQRLGFERYRTKGTTRYKGVRLRMSADD